MCLYEEDLGMLLDRFEEELHRVIKKNLEDDKSEPSEAP